MGNGKPESENSDQHEPGPDGGQFCDTDRAKSITQQVTALWTNSSEPPDVFGYLSSQTPELSIESLLPACLADQQECWSRGLQRSAEIYWTFIRAQCPAAELTALWNFVAAEWQLRQTLDDSSRQPHLEDFLRRFPDLREQLLLESGKQDPEHLDQTRDCTPRQTEHQMTSLDPTRIEPDSALTIGEWDRGSDPESPLGHCWPFTALPLDLLDHIQTRLHRMAFAPGELLIRQGDTGDGLYLIQTGEVEVRLNDHSGTPEVLGHCSDGEIIGEMSLLTDEPRTADVVAVSPVTAMFLPQIMFDQLACEYPVISEVLTQLLADRLGSSGHDALTGKTLHEYVIRNRLGRGGMAIVYKATHTRTEQDVALKMMSHRLVYDTDSLALFQRESQIIERFSHPNIVKMLDRFKAFRSFFIVMEFCPGTPLSLAIHDSGPVQDFEFRDIFRQIAAGLNHAHSHGIIHRDIKPSNIMLQPDGQVKLMDFGLANPVATDSSSSQHMISGTPRYMAPEQFRGDSVDTRADLFALGVTAWAFLTGENLITPRSYSGIAARHATWTLPDLSGFPPDIAEFLSLCLQKNPEDRNIDLDTVFV